MLTKKVLIVFLVMQLFVQLYPQSAKDFFDKGFEFFFKKDYENAMMNFNEGVALDPSNPSGYYYRGQVYMKTNKFDLALEELNKAIELNNSNYLYYNNRGVVYKALKEYSKAVEDFNKSMELNENNTKVYPSLAQIKYFLNDYKNSISIFDKAIKLDPANAYIYFFKLFVSYQLNHVIDKDTFDLLKVKRHLFNDWQKVITDLFLDKINSDEAFKKAKGDEELCEIYFYIAIKYLFLGQNDKAKEFYQKCTGMPFITFTEYQFAEFELNKK